MHPSDGKPQARPRAWRRVRFAIVVAAACVFGAGCFGGGGGGRDGLGGESSMVGKGYHLDCSIASAGWREPCLALASPNDSPSKTEIDIAVNPLDPLNVFVASKDLDPLASSCVWAVGQVTKDGGKTWKTVYVGGEEQSRQPTDPYFGWECITDPILQFTDEGVLHYSLQMYVYGATQAIPTTGAVPVPDGGVMMQAISLDGGETFGDPILMHAGDGVVFIHDYMRMAFSPASGTVFTSWNQITAPNNVIPVVVGVSRGAVTARPPTYFPTVEDASGIIASAIAASADGTLYAVFEDYDPRGGVLWASSNDDGMTFSVPAHLPPFTAMRPLEDVEFRTGTSLEIAVDQSGGEHDGCVYLTWPDGADDVADIFVKRSCDGGLSWTEPRVIHENSDDAQFFQRISVDGRGTIHVVYHTRAYDPVHHLLDTEWAWSEDGGETWSNKRLTDIASDGDLGVHQSGFPFFGDYIGISSTGEHTWMGFPHTATGRAEIAVAHSLWSDACGTDCPP